MASEEAISATPLEIRTFWNELVSTVKNLVESRNKRTGSQLDFASQADAFFVSQKAPLVEISCSLTENLINCHPSDGKSPNPRIATPPFCIISGNEARLPPVDSPLESRPYTPIDLAEFVLDRFANGTGKSLAAFN